MLNTALNNTKDTEKSSLPGSLTINMAGFTGDSIVDGPGLRCVIFCQGCPHSCPGCHNPNTHPFGCGENISLQELYDKIKAYPLCKGITFSGGEPFCQAEQLIPLAEALKDEGYELAAYSGYTFEQLLKNRQSPQYRLLSLLDVLVDGPFIQKERNLNLRFRGSNNQRILDVAKSIKGNKAVWTNESRWIGADSVCTGV